MTSAAALARDLDAAVVEAADVFVARRSADTSRPPAPGKWCAKEILGHLIDSAANNHRRFVMGQDFDDLFVDGYLQEAWVARQRYRDASWDDLVALWRAYNNHLARIVALIPDDLLGREVTRHSIDEGVRHVTLAFIVEDYIQHLQHHVTQIRALL